MCLIAFALDSHPRYSLVLVANRDEFRDRETDPADFWVDAPHLLAGRDRQAGGTWLGVTTEGKLAAVTNYRDMRQQVVDPPSRGSLVAEYLRDPGMTSADLTVKLQHSGPGYDGFNLLYGSCRSLHYFTNRGGSSGPVSPGTHALSNHLLDTRWPKVLVARERLTTLLLQSDPAPDALFQAFADSTPFSAELLPDTGIGPERERFLSPLFIRDSQYGTRTTTLIMVDRDGVVTFMEQGHDHSATPQRCFTFRLPHRYLS
jgi:uncharacterized protein with NRDE domain